MSTAAAPRQIYRAFSLLFRVPDIRRQAEDVRKLIYLTYSAAIGLRALQAILTKDPSLRAVLILMGAVITLLAVTPVFSSKEELRARSPS